MHHLESNAVAKNAEFVLCLDLESSKSKKIVKSTLMSFGLVNTITTDIISAAKNNLKFKKTSKLKRTSSFTNLFKKLVSTSCHETFDTEKVNVLLKDKENESLKFKNKMKCSNLNFKNFLEKKKFYMDELKAIFNKNFLNFLFYITKEFEGEISKDEELLDRVLNLLYLYSYTLQLPSESSLTEAKNLEKTIFRLTSTSNLDFTAKRYVEFDAAFKTLFEMNLTKSELKESRTWFRRTDSKKALNLCFSMGLTKFKSVCNDYISPGFVCCYLKYLYLLNDDPIILNYEEILLNVTKDSSSEMIYREIINSIKSQDITDEHKQEKLKILKNTVKLSALILKNSEISSTGLATILSLISVNFKQEDPTKNKNEFDQKNFQEVCIKYRDLRVRWDEVFAKVLNLDLDYRDGE
ncbi:hypothetical protein HDU92_001684 [Lobulomyces angularis]|nr:hypothetical protein HDU92_001684 [Lobulomyces angularis]